LVLGFVTNFFDTLGIGCFAPTTAYYKLRSRMPDDEIPGTLNTGQALPAVTEALIFIATVSVDLTTLVSCRFFWLRWLVVIVVVYAGVQMLKSSRLPERAGIA
jgi:hypothetical protein